MISVRKNAVSIISSVHIRAGLENAIMVAVNGEMSWGDELLPRGLNNNSTVFGAR
jgi:hypothetical protein